MGCRGPVGQCEPPVGVPQKPDLPDDAAAVWDETVARLATGRLVGLADSGAIERYCRYVVIWRRAAMVCEQEGTTRQTDRGPADAAEFRQMRQLGQELLKLELQLGLTPVARARLSQPDEPDVEDDDELFGEPS